MNPEKYITNLAMVYLSNGERMKHDGLIDEALVQLQKVEKLYMFMPCDIDAISPLYRYYIDCELHIATIYKSFDPKKALVYLEKALITCRSLAEKLPSVFYFKVAEILLEKASVYGALNEFRKSDKLIFEETYIVIANLLKADIAMKFHYWEKWLDIVFLFFRNILHLGEENSDYVSLTVKWINKSISKLTEAYNLWTEELKKDCNLLLPILSRNVSENGKVDSVVENYNGKFMTVLCRIVCCYVDIASYDVNNAIDILIEALSFYRRMALRIQANGG